MTDKDPVISLIVPTRGRPERLRSLLDSIKAMTHRTEQLEIVLVIDADDRSYDGFAEDALLLRRVVAAPGLAMGELNGAGYAAATGKFLMLLNDDVVLRSPGWDEHVLAAFRRFDDGIVLVHVNDRLFEEKLCTFPFLSRSFCELAGGICPGGYRRYRIDDHIYNVFNLLNVLGKDRILYLPEVVFEHHNFVRSATGAIEYRPDPATHARDTELFDALLAERKTLALRLARFIDERRGRDVDWVRERLLAPITDSVSLRRPEYIRVWRAERPPESAKDRVTIGIVSADLRAPHAKACIAAVKKYTRNYDLLILDNNHGPKFNHPREMNRILAACRTDFLVLMDDDVIVEAGWLDGMLRCLSPAVGVVTPLHKSADGALSYAGIVMAPDHSGRHSHAFQVPEDAFPIQTLCSAIMLIDMSKCGHLRIDESYTKYFLDIDYGLRVWEVGYEVRCSPFTVVTHLGGATLTHGSLEAGELFEEQRRHFVASWMQTDRYRTLEEAPLWRESPAIAKLLDEPRRLRELLAPPPGQEQGASLDALRGLFDRLRYYPALLRWAKDTIAEGADTRAPAGLLAESVPVEADFRGLAITLSSGAYYATPRPFSPQRAAKGAYGRYYKSQDLAALKALVAAGVTAADDPVADWAPPVSRPNLRAMLTIALRRPKRAAAYVRRKLKGARRRTAAALRSRRLR